MTTTPRGLNVPQAIWPLSDRGLAARLVDLATLRFLEGEQPYARQAFFPDLHSIDGLAPPDAVLARELMLDNGDGQRLFLGDGWSLHLVLATRRPEVQVMVTATTSDRRTKSWTPSAGRSPLRRRRMARPG